jgi:hypothetical protein
MPFDSIARDLGVIRPQLAAADRTSAIHVMKPGGRRQVRQAFWLDLPDVMKYERTRGS